MLSKKCIVCGKEIIPSTWKDRNRVHYKKYCSNKCRMKYGYPKRKDYYKKYYGYFSWQKERECKKCGKKFIPNYAWQIYCSYKCCNSAIKKRWKKRHWDKVLESQRKRWKEKQQEKIAKVEDKICPFCGKSFNPYNTGRNPYKKFCSKQCQQKSNSRKQTKRRNEILKNPSLDPVAYKKHKLRKQVQDANYKALKRECKKSDENHFTLEEWIEILEKYSYKCVDCGTKENITIDHIKPISKGGKNNKNNIEPRCQSCNAKKQATLLE
jgi:hypothetical protein